MAEDVIHSIIDLTANIHHINGVLYGECATAAATAAKTVTINGITELVAGLSIRVKFTYAQTYNGAATLNVNGLGAKNIKRIGTTNIARYEWQAGEVLDFVYDGSYWLLVDAGIATTTYYGVTKLATSATSTSTSTALTPASLNSLVLNMIANYPIFSSSETYEVGDRVRYGYNIYECKTAITTAGAWDANDWTEFPALIDMIGSGGGGLPEVTTADNGKFLRVVDGAWAAATVASATGVSF